MNTIFWLIFLFLLARSIWRLMERAGAKGKFDGPLGGPQTGMGRPIPDSEEKPKLKIPEYLTRRSEEQPGELSAKRKDRVTEPVEECRDAEPSMKGRPPILRSEGSLEDAVVKAPCRMEGKKGNPAQKRRESCDQEDPFGDLLCPGQVVKGMAWAQILGPRGGLHPKR